MLRKASIKRNGEVVDEEKPINLENQTPSAVKALWNAFCYSMSGLQVAITERAFKLEIMLACVVIPLALYLADNGVERALMIGSVMLVLIVELLNSGIESAIDRISLERHPLSKKAKDMGSAAVLLALLNWAIVWGCVLL